MSFLQELLMNKNKRLAIFFSALWLILTSANTMMYAGKPIRLHAAMPPVQTTHNNKTETWVTVFVHGIMSIQPHLTLHNLMRFIRDDVEHTNYSKTVEYMRLNPYFYLNQAMQEFGLKKIDMYDLQPGNASSALANNYDYVTKLTAPQTDNHYYTFGWSGLLSPKSRYNDAIKLFKALSAELKEKYWDHDIFPKVRLIGYSHGGNVCLNFAAAKNSVDPGSPVSVDELILIGTPIQTETDYLSADPIFKKIYHIFSRADRIQRIDFFSFNRIFSRRYFQSNNHFKVPKKLMQIEMKFTRKAKTKRENPKKLAQLTNYHDKGIVSGKSRLLRDISPGHLEFWFFGWSPKHYRKSFVLNPLPAFVTIPYILHCIKHVEGQIKNPNPVIVDIRPEFETMLIKQRRRNKMTEIFPFLSNETLNELSRTAHQVAVDSSFEDEYPQHVQDAYDKAREHFKSYDYRKKRSGSSTRNRRMRKRNLTANCIPNSQ
jgi:hypothetical protein